MTRLHSKDQDLSPEEGKEYEHPLDTENLLFSQSPSTSDTSFQFRMRVAVVLLKWSYSYKHQIKRKKYREEENTPYFFKNPHTPKIHTSKNIAFFLAFLFQNFRGRTNARNNREGLEKLQYKYVFCGLC